MPIFVLIRSDPPSGPRESRAVPIRASANSYTGAGSLPKFRIPANALIALLTSDVTPCIRFSLRPYRSQLLRRLRSTRVLWEENPAPPEPFVREHHVGATDK